MKNTLKRSIERKEAKATEEREACFVKSQDEELIPDRCKTCKFVEDCDVQCNMGFGFNELPQKARNHWA